MCSDRDTSAAVSCCCWSEKANSDQTRLRCLFHRFLLLGMQTASLHFSWKHSREYCSTFEHWDEDGINGNPENYDRNLMKSILLSPNDWKQMSCDYNPQVACLIFTYASSQLWLSPLFLSGTLFYKSPVRQGAHMVNHPLLIVPIITAGQRNC